MNPGPPALEASTILLGYRGGGVKIGKLHDRFLELLLALHPKQLFRVVGLVESRAVHNIQLWLVCSTGLEILTCTDLFSFVDSV